MFRVRTERKAVSCTGIAMKARALVFDDEPGIRTLLSTILSNRGYEVHAFPQPRSCPLLLESGCPCPPGHTCADIILTDISMPGMTGLEFIRNQMKHGCKVRNRAAISGSWSGSDLERAVQLGCKTFNKPFLIADIEGWLDDCEKRMDSSRKLWAWPLRKDESDRERSGACKPS